MPELFERRNITFPGTPERRMGFHCPFTNCALDHAIGDCSVNVVLNKIMTNVKGRIHTLRSSADALENLLKVNELDAWTVSGVASLQEKQAVAEVLPGGRLIATYTLAEMGKLPYESEVTYTNVMPMMDTIDTLDAVVLGHLQEITRSEIDCQVCYGIFHDPYTTTCGHTFCRKCLHQVLDHSKLCPICRRHQTSPGLTAERAPANVLLSKLVTRLCAEDLAMREEFANLPEAAADELKMPLFVCTLSFPEFPQFLHIFEPRYRLMVRRAVESGDRKFGMIMHNPSRQPQGDLGSVGFYQYGTLLHIENMHLMPDGRSLIETRGVSRFRVLQYGVKDGYLIGKIERVDDITISEEETIEARETSQSSPTARSFTSVDHFGAPSNHSASRPRSVSEVKSSDIPYMSTRALYEMNIAFVKRMRDSSAPWLHSRIIDAYGDVPSDMALFPWWFASVLPMRDDEKYKLLQTTSVRQRLKITSGWVLFYEAKRYVNVKMYDEEEKDEGEEREAEEEEELEFVVME